ncbi:Retrotransposon protein, Ty3-gypsy subclass [Gossypium australe]|uniref:Retrotransposon protein, Ty3-gypsy subclass n=1 Tax=Gossypium australe TaxID=47621 RepID=A0A5B6VBQ6_9ROSI|nr:Retrotransposon protein, Ty3-gypsy subclass [Gossypium australe]
MLHEALGTQLDFSKTFHLQTDGQSERVIHILKDMLWSCVIDCRKSWEEFLLLVEFAYNNSLQSSIHMVPYEALYVKATSDRHKSYVGIKRREIEYEVGDHVFLKVSLWQKVLKFGHKGKLSPRFIGQYRILR